MWQGLSHSPYQTKAHKLPSDNQTSLFTRQIHWNSSMTSSWRQRWVQQLFLRVAKGSILSLHLHFLYHFFTFPSPTVSHLVPRRLTTPHTEPTALFPTNQPNLRLKPVASWQLRTLIRSVTMLRSCVHTTAIYLELQPQYSVTRSIYST